MFRIQLRQFGLAFFLLSSIALFPQDYQLKDFIERHQEFFASSRENFHLHLNKTAFLKGEQVWFKAYVYDQNSQRPSSNTSNLYVGAL